MKIIRILLIVVALVMGFVYFYNVNRDQALKETGVVVNGVVENKEHKSNRVNGKTEENYLFTISYSSATKTASDVFVVDETVYAKYNNGDSIELIEGQLNGNTIISVKEMETPQSAILLWFAFVPLAVGIALFFSGRNKNARYALRATAKPRYNDFNDRTIKRKNPAAIVVQLMTRFYRWPQQDLNL